MRPHPARRAQLEALEPRILYAADLAAVAAGASLASAPQQQQAWQPAASSPTATAASARELVVVDLALPQAQTLLAGLQAQREAGRALDIVTVGAGEDGLAVVGQALEARSDVAAVHLLGHGADGRVALGTATLDGATLVSRAGEIARWGASLSGTADLLVYGCDVAATAQGRQLLADLAALTGADVAGSDDATGAAALGGDWILEHVHGPVEAASIADAALQQAYGALLGARPAGSVASADSAVPQLQLVFEHTVGSGNDRLLVVQLAVDNAVAATSVSYGDQALTRIGLQAAPGNSVGVELWVLASPALGTAEVTVTLPSAQRVVAGAATFYNVDLANPFDAVSGQGGTGARAEVAVAGSAHGERVVDVVAAKGVSSVSADTGQGVLWQRNQGGTAGDLTAQSSHEAGASVASSGHQFVTAGPSPAWAMLAVSLNANNVQAPRIISHGGGDAASLSVTEGQAAVTTVAADDPESDTLTYSIAGGADAARFAIDAATGVLRFVAAPDFEAPADADADNLYEVVVRASDGRHADEQRLFVTVEDAADPLQADVAPSVLTAQAVTVQQGQVLAFASAGGIQVADDRAHAGGLQAELAVSEGRLQLDPLIGGVGLVNDAVADKQTDPQVAVAADGHYVVVWQHYRNPGQRHDILARLYNADGTPRTAELVVAAGTAEQIRPSVAIDDETGQFVVAWQHDEGAGFPDEIALRVFDADGTPANGGFYVQAVTGVPLGSNLRSPHVALYGPSDARRIALVFEAPWPVDLFTTQPAVILMTATLAQAADPSLTALPVDFSRVSTNGEGAAPVVAGSTAGFVVAWDHSLSPWLGVRARLYDVEGNPVGNQIDVNQHFPGNQMRPSVAMNASGAFAIAWQSEQQPGDANGFAVVARRFGPDGVPAGNEFLVNTFTIGDQHQPAVSLTEDGRLSVIWTSASATTADGTDIFLRSYTADGSTIDGPLRINDTGFSGNQTTPALGGDRAGNLVAAWQTPDTNIASNTDIAARRLLVGGAPALALRGTQAELNAALQTLRYAPDVGQAGLAAMAIRVSQSMPASMGPIQAESGLATTRILPITVLQANDAPVLSGPASLTTAEDTPLVISAGAGTLIQVSDPDAGQRLLQLSLSVSHGTLTLASTAGLSFTTGVSGAAAITVQGRQADLQAALDGLVYRPAADYAGSDALVLVVDDLGHGDFGPAKSASHQVTLTVSPVEDAPRIGVPAAFESVEGAPVIFSRAAGRAITVDDPDPATVKLRVTLEAGVGTLTLASTAGLVFVAGDGSDDARVSFVGTPAQVDAALDGLQLQLPAHFTGAASVRVSADDSGTTDGHGRIAFAVAAFTVMPDSLNAAPRLELPDPQRAEEGLALTLSRESGNAIVVTDDAGSSEVRVTIGATGGTVWLDRRAGTETGVNRIGGGQQEQARMAVLPDGSHVVVWLSNGSQTGLVAQRFDAQGQPIGAEWRIEPPSGVSYSSPAIAADAQGGIAIAWVDAGASDSKGIRLRRYTIDGVLQGAEVGVNTTTVGDQVAPSVAIDALGRVLVAWQSADAAGQGIFAQRFAADGSRVGGEFQVNARTAGDQLAPQVAMSAQGKAVVVWSSQHGAEPVIVARRVDATQDSALDPEFDVASELGAGAQTAPAVAMTAAGDWAVAWQSPDASGSGIFVKRFPRTGPAIDDALPVNVTTAGDQTRPSVALSTDGTLVVAWQGPDDSGEGVYARLFKPGFADSPEIALNTTTAGHQGAPSAGIAADGTARVAWSGERQGGDSSEVASRALLRPDALFFDAGDGIDDATVTFRGTLPDVNAALDGLRFAPSAGFAGMASLTVQVDDLGATGAGGARQASGRIDIVVGGAPMLDLDADDSAGRSGADFQVSYESGQGPVRIADADASLAVPGGGTVDKLVVTIVGRPDGGEETFDVSMTGTTGISRMWQFIPSTQTYRLVLEGAAPVAMYEQLLRGITYDNTAVAPTPTTRKITVVATSDEGDSNAATVFISFPSANAPPTAQADAYTALQGQPRDVPAAQGVLANDSDADGDALVAELTAAPSSGTLTFRDDGSFRYEPGVGFHGTDQFSYRAGDGQGWSAEKVVTLTVLPVNTAPTGTSGTRVLVEDSPRALVAADFGFSDPVDGHALAGVRIATLPAAGSLRLNGLSLAAGTVVTRQQLDDGALVYTPPANANGAAVAAIGFQVRDDGGTANGGLDTDPVVRTLTLDVAPAPDKPVVTVSPDPQAYREGDPPLALVPAATVADIDGPSAAGARLTIDIGSGRAAGDRLSLRSDGDGPGQVAVEGTTLRFGGVAVGTVQAGADGTSLTVDFGSAATVASVQAALRNLVFDNASDTPATPTRHVRIAFVDGDDLAAEEVYARVAVTPVDDAPVTRTVTLGPMDEDGTLVITAAQLLSQASDPEGAKLSASALVVAGLGTGTVTETGPGTWQFTPAPNTHGTVTFRYTISDGVNAVEGTAVLQVTPVNDAPVTSPVTLPSMDEDGPAQTITPAQLLAGASDADGDPLVATGLVLASGQGQLEDLADGRWRFTPDPDWSGTASFAYQVKDPALAMAAGTAELTVLPVNDAPVTAPVTLPAMDEDGPAQTITLAQLLAGASDADGDLLSVRDLRVGDGQGTVTALGGGLWAYTPAPDWHGTAAFSYLVSDGQAETPGTASLTVRPVNDAPRSARVELDGVDEDSGPRLITQDELLSRARDVDGDALKASGLQVVDGQGSLEDLGDGRWQFTPAPGWSGTVELRYLVGDGSVTVDGQAGLGVAPVNDPPVVTSPEADGAVIRVAEGGTAVTTVTATDADDDRVRLRIAGGADAEHFEIDEASGELRWRRAPDFEQPADADRDNRYELVVEARDGSLAVQRRFTVEVTNVDEAPRWLLNRLTVTDARADVAIAVSDPDTPDTALVLSVSDATGGGFERVATPGVAIDRFTVAELKAGEVVFRRDGSGVVPGYRLSLSDGSTRLAPDAPQVLRPAAGSSASALVGPPSVLPAAKAADPIRREAGTDAGGGAASAAAPAPGTRSASTAATGRGPDGGDGNGSGDEQDGTVTAGDRVDAAEAADGPASSSARSAASLLVMRARQALALTASAAVPVVATATTQSVTGAPVTADVPLQALLALMDEALQGGVRSSSALSDGASSSRNSLLQALDRLKDEVGRREAEAAVTIGTTALVSSGVSVGYVLWMLRGGVLVTMVMSSMPAWAGFDPLPVLSRAGAGGAGGDAADDDDPVERLFARARRLMQRSAASVARTAAPAPAPAGSSPADDRRAMETPA